MRRHEPSSQAEGYLAPEASGNSYGKQLTFCIQAQFSLLVLLCSQDEITATCCLKQ